MIRIIPLIIFVFIYVSAFTQITTNPELPTASKQVTITFDSSKDSRLGKFTGDLYAHTGVVIEGSTEWQHVIGTWGNNTTQPKLTNKGDGIYELSITPDIKTFYSATNSETITKMAFVFRSSDSGSQSNDILVNVYEDGLVINISSPNDESIVNKNAAIAISANSSNSGNLGIYINENLLTETSGQTITANHTFTTSGNYWIIAKIEANNEVAYDSISVYVKEEIIEETKPTSYRKGINYTGNQSVALVLWAPNKEFVYAIGDFNNWEVNENYQMKKDGDYFWLEIEGLTAKQEYTFQYYIDGELKIADPYCEKIADPWNDSDIPSTVYPDLITYPEGKTSGIASVLQTAQDDFQWEVQDFNAPDKNQLIVYELLVRDFTSSHSYSGVKDKLDYLEDLNINVLELMPVNEFEGNSSWGYNPSFYFAPDKYYGPKDELKDLIDECHKRGIAVVLDMVLNHSYGQSPFIRMYADETGYSPSSENPWYNEEHNFQNPDAQWGSDFNHESIYTKELVDSITSFWMSEYKVDGFRFDFTKGFSNTVYGTTSWGSDYDAARIKNLKRMTDEIWKRKNDAIVIFEHLAVNTEETELANYGILLWGNMNYNYSEASMGYFDNNKSELKGAVYTERGWNSPNLVAYMESHDEERIMYQNLQNGNSLGTYNITELPTALNRMELNSVFLIPLPGPKMIWQFGEVGYDYSINSNGGRLNEKTIRWDYLDEEDRTDLFRVMAKLNFLKQNYSEFQSGNISYNLTNEVKTYTLSSDDGSVVVIGNFGLSTANTTINFPQTGTWYDYFAESSFTVSSTNQSISLQAGEYKLFTSRQMSIPHISTSVEPNLESQSYNVQFYPNPCTNILNINTNSKVNSINIFSNDGKLIEQTSTNKFPFKLNTKNLKPGIYILQLAGEAIESFTFVKN